MKIDKERLENKIYYIRSNLKKLKELREISKDEFLEDYRNCDSAKYNLQISIEALIDIGNHIISRENYGIPKTNADTFRILAKENIISKERLKSYIAMTKFRNMVVHLYEEIDENEIYDIIQNNLDDFEYFIKDIFNKYLI
jgi:uncharacterized protein YutE (UPF0331/DUF86 family)